MPKTMKVDPPVTPHVRHIIFEAPAELATLVGQIAIRWSSLVWTVQQCTYTALGLPNAQARIAVRDPRPDEHIQMIESLMKLAGFKTSTNFAGLREDLTALKGLRDNLCHGVWTTNPDSGKITIQIDSGNWVPSGHNGKRSRRETPEARGVDAEGLRSIMIGLEDCIRMLQVLLLELETQVSSIDRYPPERPSAHPRDGSK